MTIKMGDRIPEATFTIMTSDGPQTRTTEEFFKGRRVVLIGVPGLVPEPASWAIMLLGFGVAGASFRAQRRALQD